MDRTNHIFPPPIPITGVAKVPCPNQSIYCRKAQRQIVRKYIGMTDRIRNANKLKDKSPTYQRHIKYHLKPKCITVSNINGNLSGDA